MEYGTAYHKALQEYYTTGNSKAALAAALEHYEQPDIHIPDNDFRDIGHLAATLQQYFMTYEKFDGLKADMGDDGPLLEQRFAIPYETDGEMFKKEDIGIADSDKQWVHDTIATHAPDAEVEFSDTGFRMIR